MQFITTLTCEAHVEVMRRVKPGMKEYQMRAIFEGMINFYYKINFFYNYKYYNYNYNYYF